ncbi:MAG: TspO/MBR family protein [bacterium]
MNNNAVRVLVSFAVPLLAGALGSLATRPAITGWYATLNKPPFNPPGWLFGPAWTVLYILMGLAAYLVWSRGLAAPGVKPALALFVVQMFLNVLWSFLFFAARSPLAGFVEIVALWAAILVTMVLFFRVSPAAGWLMVPYIGWVSFAAVLNGAIMLLNRKGA